MEGSRSDMNRATTAAMQSIPDTSLMTYMDVPGTEADVAAMDDLQFMDALLDNDDATFGDTESGNGIPMTTSCSNTNANTNTNTGAYQRQLPPVAVSETSSLSSSRLSVSSPAEKQQLQQSQQLQQTTNPGASSAMASPVTARLNYPFVVASTPNSIAFSALPTAAPTAATVAPTRLPEKGGSSQSSITFSDHAPNNKRVRDNEVVQPITQGDGDKKKRRMDRNQREQQRSHKITEQISYLRDLLADANVHFKPDKHSTLISVVEYIRQLQSKSQLLDAEHKKLLETISRTNEVAKSPYYQTTADGQTVPGSNDLLVDAPAILVLEEEHTVFVNGLDYKNVFKQCNMALAVASIDGRLMDCNSEFESLTEYARDELLPGKTTHESSSTRLIVADSVQSSDGGVQSKSITATKRNLSLFNLLGREDMENVFMSMSLMLKQPIALGNHNRRRDEDSPNSGSSTQLDFWSGYVTPSRRVENKVLMNVTLVRSPQGRPKFFQCALTTKEEESATPSGVTSEKVS